MQRALLTILVWLAFLGAASAQQRPLVTEDPETIGNGRVLLEGGVEFANGVTNTAYGIEGDITRIGVFGVSVGAGSIAEVQVDGGVLQNLDVNRRIPGGPLSGFVLALPGDSTTGFEDLIVATKIRFAAETDSRPAMGIRLGTRVPTGNPDNGVSFGTTDFFSSFLLAKTVRSVRTVGNVGLLFLGNPEDARDHATSLSYGVSIARAVTNAFEVVGELNGRLPPFEEFTPPGLESRSVFRLAGRYTYSWMRLDFGILAGLTERDPSFGFTGGITYVIAP